jgi:hypothetical protein
MTGDKTVELLRQIVSQLGDIYDAFWKCPGRAKDIHST